MVCEKGTETDVIIRCARTGFDNFIGYLVGGIEAWTQAGFKLDTIGVLSNEEFVKDYKNHKVIDVRGCSGFAKKHVKSVESFDIFKYTDSYNVKSEEDYWLMCQTNYTAMIMASVFKRKGG